MLAARIGIFTLAGALRLEDEESGQDVRSPSSDQPSEPADQSRLSFRRLDAPSLRHHIVTLANAPVGSEAHKASAHALMQHYYRHIYNTVRDEHERARSRGAVRGPSDIPFDTQSVSDAFGTLYGRHGRHVVETPLKAAAEDFVRRGLHERSRNAEARFGAFVKGKLSQTLRSINRNEAIHNINKYGEAKSAQRLIQQKPDPRPTGREPYENLQRRERSNTIRDYMHAVINDLPIKSDNAENIRSALRNMISHQLKGTWVASETSYGRRPTVQTGQVPEDIRWTSGKLAVAHGIHPATMNTWIDRFHEKVREVPELGKIAAEWLEGGLTLDEAFGIIFPLTERYRARTFAALAMCEGYV